MQMDVGWKQANLPGIVLTCHNIQCIFITERIVIGY